MAVVMPGATPPAVVGLARYGTPDPVRIFIRSFLANRVDSHLYLLVDRRDARAWRAVESDVVHIRPVRHFWIFETNVRAQYWLRRAMKATGVLHLVAGLDQLLLKAGRWPLAPFFEQPHVSRLRHQARLIEGALRDAPWIFLSDTRDVAFQRPFEDVFATCVANAPLHVYEEGIALGDAADMAGAPQAHQLDPSLDASLAGSPVLCVGTVLGRPGAMAEFLERMLRVIAIRPGRYPRMLDQGALNLLYYDGRLDDLGAVAHPLGEAGVVTCAVVTARPELTVEGDALRWSGVAPPVVHQFDRVPGLDAVYDRSFPQ